MSQESSESPESRRGFFSRTAAVVFSAAAIAIPAVSALFVIFDPLRKRGGGTQGFVRIATLSSLPNDGVPRKFPVLATRSDAWTKYPNVPIGAVYLRRTGESVVEALNVVCPHAGCFVDFSAEKSCYLCPCHNSSFALSGQINDKKSPSPRSLDTLEIQVRGEEIWVRFQNFRAGTAEKIPAT
jgi:menaquinol-cytochrome c reductase iron-sulfur subunit